MSEPVWRERSGYKDLRAVLDPADASGNKNRYIDLVQKLALDRKFKMRHDDVVVDFGCGVGRFTDWLEARAGTVIGIDSVPEMIDVARELHPNSRCQWLTYSGQRLPLEDKSANRILSVGVLQHVLDDELLGNLVADFGRVLRPAGTVAVIEQVVPGHGNEVPGYIQHRTAQHYEEVFAGAGFRAISSAPIRTPWRIAYAVVRLERVFKVMQRPLAEATLLMARRLSAKAAYTDQLMVFSRAEAQL